MITPEQLSEIEARIAHSRTDIPALCTALREAWAESAKEAERADKADLCIQSISVTLDGADEWDDQQSMISSVEFLAQETADRIIALEAERDKMRAALKPFSDAANTYNTESDDMFVNNTQLRLKHLRASRAALQEQAND
jgi:hypothetical protein